MYVRNFFVSAMSDNGVWAEGLQIFYEIFKYLEQNVDETILPKAFHRKEAFEKDLEFYLGAEWKANYVVRAEVQQYLSHLDMIKAKDPMLLIAYVYHLYMGLLSGGQILQKKRDLAGRWGKVDESNRGAMLTTFEGLKISELKSKMRNNIDEMAQNWSEEFKQELLLESKYVFELNNTIVRSIKSVDRVGYRRLAFIVGLVIVSIVIVRAVTSSS